jgi:tetratricopeptide (TPR) repeat protein
VASSCATPRAGREPLGEAELRALAEARRREQSGDLEEAARRYREMIAARPGLVSAHRALQNLELAEHRRGELLVRYGRLREAAPGESDRWYLWGRVLSDPRAQDRAFEKAQSLDPRSPWPWFGLGALALSRESGSEGLKLLRRARELAPDVWEIEAGLVRALIAEGSDLEHAERLLADCMDSEGWDAARVLQLADLRARQQRPREAIEVLGRLLARLPRNGEAAARLWTEVERSATPDDAAWLVRELEAGSNEPAVARVLARCHAMRGDVEAAMGSWASLEAIRSEEAAWMRLLRVARGELEAAIAPFEDRFRALKLLGVETPAWDELRRRLSDAGGFEADVCGRALRNVGWIEEAIVLLRAAARDPRRSAEARELLIELLSQRQLEAELRVLALEVYREFDDERRETSLDRMRARIGESTMRTLGVDRMAETPFLSFWPVGVIADEGAPTGLPAWFRRGGRLFVVGQRSGRPPEILLAPVLARIAAGPQGAEISFVEGMLVGSWLEHRGQRFAGAALERFGYVDVAAIEDDVNGVLALERRLGAARERVLADPVEGAADRAGRVRVDEPAEVVIKLRLRALDEWRRVHPTCDRAELLADAIDAVLVHETAHLEDADRFLPFGAKLWRSLPELVRLGFSARRVEEWLEMRAEAVALARARDPHWVLAGCVSQAHGTEDSVTTPHGSGYRELLERLVAVLDGDPSLCEGLDRRCVLLQQLDRLAPDAIRAVARRLLAQLGIEEESSLSSPRDGAR